MMRYDNAVSLAFRFPRELRWTNADSDADWAVAASVRPNTVSQQNATCLVFSSWWDVTDHPRFQRTSVRHQSQRRRRNHVGV